jgi:hypothetical protein
LGDGSRNAQASSDIFSFGVIAFELMTGTRPYLFPPVLGGVIHANVVETLATCRNLSSDVAIRLARCLDMAPEKRPGARELVESIRRNT